MTTRSTNELRLLRAVPSIDMAAFVAPLARVTRIYSDNTTTSGLGFIFEKTFKLSEGPRMNSPFGFSLSCLHSRSNVCQVLNHDGRSRRNVLQNALTQYVIAIPSESLFTTREAAKMAFSRLRAISLQFSLQAEAALTDFSPAFLTMQTSIGSDGWATDPEVNTERLSVVDELHIVKLENKVENELPLAIHKVGGGGALANERFGIIGHIECNILPPARCSEIDDAFRPIDRKCMEIVSRRAKSSRRTVDLSSFLTQCDSRFDGFSRFLPCLHMQIGN